MSGILPYRMGKLPDQISQRQFWIPACMGIKFLLWCSDSFFGNLNKILISNSNTINPFTNSVVKRLSPDYTFRLNTFFTLKHKRYHYEAIMDYENRVNRTEESEKEIEIKDGVPVAAKLEAIKNRKKRRKSIQRI